MSKNNQQNSNKDESKNNQQTSTKNLLPAVIPQDTQEILKQYQTRAIELRYEGETYQKICGVLAQELNCAVQPQTIRKWFARGGILSEAYTVYASKENEHREKITRNELRKLIPKIPVILGAALSRTDDNGNPDFIALRAL